MVQDFTTSFDHFETFALSEMAKQPEKDDPLGPFMPKFWTNIDSNNPIIKSESMTSLIISSPDLSLTPRRSGRLAIQKKINYNENIPKKEKLSQKRKQRKSKKNNKASSKKNRIKAIKSLFMKPACSDHGDDTANPKSKAEDKYTSFKISEQMCKIPTSLRISIPLVKTNFFSTSSVTKASLKLFDEVLTIKPENSDLTKMEVSDERSNSVRLETILGNTKNCQVKNETDFSDASKKNVQPEQQKAIEDFEQREHYANPTKMIKSSNEIKIQTELIGNVFGKRFTGFFQVNQNDSEVSFVGSSKKNKKLTQKPNTKTLRNRKTAKIKLPKCKGIKERIPRKNSKLEENFVKEAFEERKDSPDDFMEVSDGVQKINNPAARNEDLEDYQMMEISSESFQFSEKKVSKNTEHFSEDSEASRKTQKPEESVIKEASQEKQQPLDLTVMDTSDEIWKPRQNDFINQSNNTEDNEEFSEDLSIMEVSNEIPDSKKIISSKDSDKVIPNSNVSIFDSLKKNTQFDQNFTDVEGQSLEEKSNKIETSSMSKVRNDDTHVSCALLSDSLSIMKISEHIQKPDANMNDETFEEKDELSISKVMESLRELQNPTPPCRRNFSDDTETSSENDDVFILENEPLAENNIKGVFNKYQSQSSSSQDSTVMQILDETKNDRQTDESSNEKEITEELKSLVEESPLDDEGESFDDNLTEESNDFETPEETVGVEVEIYEESNDSEVEVIEETFLDNSENLDEQKNEEDFNKSSDDVEMPFLQGCHRVYQPEFIEVVHQYNYFPFQNYQYQYPRFEYPIEENKFDYRPTTNLPFLSQRYGEFQIPQMHLDYNNYRIQVHTPYHGGNFEPENKLEITELYECDEEEKENEKDKPQLVDVNQNDVQKTLHSEPQSNTQQNEVIHILSLPPPIQCSYEQQRCPPWQNVNPLRTQLYLHAQSNIGQVSDNISSQLEECQDNLESTNNNSQWQIISTQNSGQTSSEQRDSELYENTGSYYQVLPYNNEQNQSGTEIVQRLHQVPVQNIHQQPLQSENIHQRQFQAISQNNQQQEYQPLSQIAYLVKNNCQIDDVKFGKVKMLNGRLYRTGSLFITFGDHFKVQVIGDVILNNINDNIAFDAFFSPRNQF